MMEHIEKGAGGHTLSGVYAALITPVGAQGRPDLPSLLRLADFAIDRGVDGLCLGGGTAEYPHFSLDERKLMVAAITQHVNGRVPLLAAIGAPTVHGVLELGEHALVQGVGALLLPMPFFYRYGQEDLCEYARHVARSLSAPCFLYNLTAFTNPIHPDTSLELLQSESHIVGLKDSSGDWDAVRVLSHGRRNGSFSLMCGSDGLVFDALEAGWDGSVSGIASCCPEVLVALYGHHKAGRTDEAERCQRLLDMLVEIVGRMPFPWSIRVAAEVRGFSNGPMPYPLSEHRQRQVKALRDEYERWFEEHLPTLQIEEATDANSDVVARG